MMENQNEERSGNCFADGPFVQAACFCDMALEDKSGVLSLIRIIDTITHVETGPDVPDAMPPVPYRLNLVLMLKSGTARGRRSLRIVPQLPSGETPEPFETTVHFSGEEQGHNVVLTLDFVFPLEGLYWFNVEMDGERFTSLPIRIRYNRQPTSGSLLH